MALDLQRRSLWIVSPLDDKARRADHFGRSIERASAHRPNGGLGGAGPYARFLQNPLHDGGADADRLPSQMGR
jgi:hypothetical protein